MDLAQILRARQPAMARRRRAPGPKLLRPVRPLAADALVYGRQLEGVVTLIRHLVEGRLFPILHRQLDAEAHDDFANVLRTAFGEFRFSLIDLAIQRFFTIASGFVRRINAKHREEFYRTIDETLGVDLNHVVSESGLEPILKLKTEENVALIKSIPEQYLGKIERLVYEAVIQGRKSSKSLEDEIRQIGKVTASRAKFIARDQTSKLVAALNRERNQAVGIKEYIWRTSKDERVRPTHRSKEGRTYRWDAPPKDTGAPGTDYNCRCVSAPVLKF